MKRLKDEFVLTILKTVPLIGSKVLEVGCGAGTRSERLAAECAELVGIDPDLEHLKLAKAKGLKNTTFLLGAAEKLAFKDASFDHVVFTLSLHHVPLEKMNQAVTEAIRVVKKDGYIVFLEPGTEGNFFEAEQLFYAGDANEDKPKKAAHDAIKNHPGLKHIAELDDETVIQYESVADFCEAMHPQKSMESLEEFLIRNNYILQAQRRINICTPLSA